MSDWLRPSVVLLLLSVQQANADDQTLSEPGPETRPNIIFIMVDDLGKDYVSCYGADGVRTPHIDRLAEQGMKFHNAWSMPQCTPTRVTLLTGQYPWRTGWVNHWDVPRWGVGYFDWELNLCFPRVLRECGYRTAIAGKWQINDFRVEPHALDKHGFDEWSVWTGYETQNPASAERYWDPYIHTADTSMTHEGKFGPDLYCDFLIEFMQRNREEPMFVYFPMALTHGPLVPTPHSEPTNDSREKLIGMVEYTDHLVGRIVSTVEELGLAERTIIIFTTDNGTSRGLLGTVDGSTPSGGKASKYEGGVCQPFIAWGPGRISAGSQTNALTDFSDLFPTFVDLAGGELPDDVDLDGHSFAPVLLGEDANGTRDWIMALGYGPAIRDADGVRGRHDFADRVIRNERYKAWIDTERRIEALYDLQVDPLERENLLVEPGERPTNPELRAAYDMFFDVLQDMPARDARPRYRVRDPLPWDRPITER